MGTKDQEEDARVTRAADGDSRALEELLRECSPRLRAGLVLQPRWRRSLDTEDVLQVTFLEAFLRVGSLRTRTLAGFEAWLSRIAGNNLRDAVRGLQRDKRPRAHARITRGPEGESARTLLARLANEQPSVGALVAGREAMDNLRAALERIPETYRRVVEAVDLEERPVAVVAAEEGRSPGAVHMLRSRAHDRLRELLGGETVFFGDSS